MAAQTISVGTCHSMTEALMIRSLLGARDIEAIIPGLGSGSAIVAYTSCFESQVLVDREHAEEARALIAQLREGQDAQEGPGDEAPGGAVDADDRDDAGDEMRELSLRRRRIVTTTVASFVVPFGGGHFLHGAWARGAALAALQAAAVWYTSSGHRSGLLLVFAVLCIDLYGGMLLARGAASLPVARTMVPRLRRAP